MSGHRGRRGLGAIALVVILHPCVLAPALAADEEPLRFRGRPLAEALRLLEQDGLRVIFSSELVRPEMKVAREPRAAWPREILDELLAPHGLRASPGPAGVLLVVESPPGAITGVVRLAGSTKPLAGVRLVAVGSGVEAVTDARGRFELGPLVEGRYAIEADLVGYLSGQIDDVPVGRGRPTRVDLEMSANLIPREQIIVQADAPATGAPAPDPTIRYPVAGAELGHSPGPSHDPLSAVSRLAGVAEGDATGELHIRGGSGNEVKFVLDGLELYEPFHLRERGGLIGIVDSRNLAGLGLLGGAFPAEYGGHMSAIVEFDSVAASDELRTGLEVGSDDMRLESQGPLAGGHWFVSARRGNPQRVLEALGADPAYRPLYHDVFGKIDRPLGERTRLSLNVLAAGDEIEGDDGNPIRTIHEPGSFRARHRSRYAWVHLERGWSEKLFSRLVLSAGRLDDQRAGSSPLAGDVDDRRSTRVLGFRQDWIYRAEGHLLKWGLDVKHLGADYRYGGAGSPIETVAGGTDLGLYVADRLRVAPGIELELGLRWDSQSYVGGADNAVSPRVNAAWSPDPRTTLRLGWGLFRQQQKIHELQVEDGIVEFFPAQTAEHRLLSLDRRLAGDLQLRLTAYSKRMSKLKPRYENLFDPLGFFPEADGDRVRIAPSAARADGLEFSLRGAAGKGLDWWARYTLARAEDRIEGSWVPRSWDQRHSIDAAIGFAPWKRWRFDVAGSYHSGRPTTAVAAELVPSAGFMPEIVPLVGPRNGLRLPAYQRVDLRVSHTIPLRGGRLRFHANLTNVLNRRNVCCVDRFDFAIGPEGSVSVAPEYRGELPSLLTFGAAWTF